MRVPRHATGRRAFSSGLVLLLGLACIGAFVPVRPAFAANDGGLLSILVLGDSYSAGNGAGSYYGPKSCYRSSRNYAREFEREIEKSGQRAFVENRACSGAVTKDFFGQQHKNVPAQLTAINRGYDLVFLTFGGNDLKFSDIAQKCLVAARRDGVDCDKLLSSAETELGRGNVDFSVERRLTSMLIALGEDTDPRAKIVFIGYPYLEGDRNYRIRRARFSPHFVNVGARLRALQDLGDRVQQRVVRRVGRAQKTDRFVFVKTKALFAGKDRRARGPATHHELFAQKTNPHRWFVQPLVDTAVLAESPSLLYHPNRRGWREEGRLLARTKGVPKRDLNSGPVHQGTSPQPLPNPGGAVSPVGTVTPEAPPAGALAPTDDGGREQRPVYDHVTALAPTDGPVGYRFAFTGPPCQAPFGHGASVTSFVSVGGHSGGGKLGVSASDPSGWTMRSPLADDAGLHEATVSCVDDVNQSVIWTEPLVYTLSGTPQPLVLAGTAREGGSVSFVSGASACPTIAGLVPTRVLYATGFSTTPGQGESLSPVPLPTSLAFESKPLPAYVRAGDSASAGAYCHYKSSNAGSTTEVADFSYVRTLYTVGPPALIGEAFP